MKKLVIMMTICLTMLLSVSVTKADIGDTLELGVTYRDFLDDTHPDFGFPSGPYGLDLGIVAETLSEEGGTPDYAGEPGTNTTHGADNFYDWYHDTSASSTISGRSLIFTEIAANEYQYSSGDDGFFPLDDLGITTGNDIYGNPLEHNFYFTMELHTSFTYVYGEGVNEQIFSFVGDDDLFVYINKELVIDLGGIHNAEPDGVASVSLNSLGLTPGETYSFDLFFAERNPTASDFTATTNIVFNQDPVVPVPGALLLGLLGFGATGIKLRKFA